MAEVSTAGLVRGEWPSGGARCSGEMQPELLRVLASKGVSDEDLRTHPPLIQTPALQVRNVLVRGWGRRVEFGPGKGVCSSEEDEGIIRGRGGDLLTPALESAPLHLLTGSESLTLPGTLSAFPIMKKT